MGIRLAASGHAALLAISALALTSLDVRAAIREAPAAPARGASVLAGVGEARVEGGAPYAIRPGDALPARVELRAAATPLRLALPGGASVELEPGAEAALAGELEVPFEDGGKMSATRLDLRRGEAAIEATARAGVVVHGPGDVLAATRTGATRARVLPRHGTFSSALAFASYDGSAAFAVRGAFKPLAVGSMVELRAGQAASPARPLGPGPAWLHGEDEGGAGPLAIVTTPFAIAELSARFAPTSGATSYEAEIARDPGFGAIVARRALAAEETTLRTPPLPAGRYFARVRARGPEVLPGQAGATRALRVARAILPAGGAAEGSSVLLPSGGAFTWDDPGELEIALDRIGFVHALKAVTLGRDDAAVAARVRLAGDRASVPLTIVSSSVRVEIALGPKRAEWPRDPVEVRVRLVGAAPTFEPILRVTVNLVELAVRWRREGDVFLATVPPRSSSGPWVVRAEASDPLGNELARGFVEVIATGAP